MYPDDNPHADDGSVGPPALPFPMPALPALLAAWETPTADAPLTGATPRPLRLEFGRAAAESLMRGMGDALLRVMLSAQFAPVDDHDVVPVIPCPFCAEGALRLAGSLTTPAGREVVRGCDTCGAVEVGERRIDAKQPRATGMSPSAGWTKGD